MDRRRVPLPFLLQHTSVRKRVSNTRDQTCDLDNIIYELNMDNEMSRTETAPGRRNSGGI